jgi:hypothetical protein
MHDVSSQEVFYAFQTSGVSPANVAGLDSFRMESLARQDIAATGLTWNTTESGVDFSYRVSGADLTQTTTAALYWAHGTTFADRIGGPVSTTSLEQQQGDHGPFFVPNSFLGSPPPDATHLLLVTDPDNVVAETDETNNVAALAIPDIVLKSATTDDSRSVRFEYEVTGAPIDQFQVNVYRSARPDFSPGHFDPSQDVQVDSRLIQGATPGPHSERWDVPLPTDPAHPYVFVAADPADRVPETDESNNVASFRKRVLGVVTNGLIPTGFLAPFGARPEWVYQTAALLHDTQMYDVAIPFDWSFISVLPIPQVAVRAGTALAGQVGSTIQQMKASWPNDIIDVHLIGHSRRAVVISTALAALQANVEVTRGYATMTMLDPHPAHNHPLDPQYSASPEVLGRILEGIVERFQERAQDPEVIVPANVDKAQVFYQHTPWYRISSGIEQFLNLWGEVPVINRSSAPVEYHDLTAPDMTHRLVVDWYVAHVLRYLKNGGTAPSSAGRSVSRPAGGQVLAGSAALSVPSPNGDALITLGASGTGMGHAAPGGPLIPAVSPLTSEGGKAQGPDQVPAMSNKAPARLEVVPFSKRTRDSVFALVGDSPLFVGSGDSPFILPGMR